MSGSVIATATPLSGDLRQRHLCDAGSRRLVDFDAGPARGQRVVAAREAWLVVSAAQLRRKIFLGNLTAHGN